jgi:hypothetical protein
MAIKGKKKSQTRGSQARRRPATAPRVVTSRQAHVPWYQTSGGRVVAAIVVVLLLAGVGIAIAQMNASGNRRERRQEALDEYTGDIRDIALAADPAAARMQQLLAKPPGDDEQQLKDLRKQAEDWVGTFTGARPEPELKPPAGLSSLSALFGRSIDAYASAATTYQLAAKATDDDRAGLLTLATQQQQIAAGVWVSAVEVLDQERVDAGLQPSGIKTPGLATPGTG